MVTMNKRRNWAGLPEELLYLIFSKLNALEILFHAQMVCSSWREFTKEPHLFSSIDMRNTLSYFKKEEFDDFTKFGKTVVSRSCGELVELSIEHLATDELLIYLVENAKSLKSLRLVYCHRVTCYGLVEVAKNCAFLEELELCYTYVSEDDIKRIGRSCPQLKYFRYNYNGVARFRPLYYDEVASAIAVNMPQLRRLHLFGSGLTNTGLQAILDHCLHLEHLDLRRCFSLHLKGDLLFECQCKIKYLRVPMDSTSDYEFQLEIKNYGSNGDVEL